MKRKSPSFGRAGVLGLTAAVIAALVNSSTGLAAKGSVGEVGGGAEASALASRLSTNASPSPSSSSFPRAGSEAEISSNFDISQFVLGGGQVPASTASEPSGNFRLDCQFSHLNYDDPIVYPGQPGKSHLHMYFGNSGTDANSTYASLRTSGDGSCQGGPLNRSGYWIPAVFNAAGNVVVPDFAAIYYKGTNSTTAEIQNMIPIPTGLKMIAGYNMATGASDPNFAWLCDNGTTKTQTIPNCPAGQRVGVQMVFPQCWDGVNLDSPDHRSHLAYIYYDHSVAKCPADHPVHIPQYTIGIWFTHDGDSQDWYLASDRMPGMPAHANGSTFHSDWIGAWDPAIQHEWTKQCINTMRDCKGGQLGDGTYLKPYLSYTGPKILTPPPKPG